MKLIVRRALIGLVCGTVSSPFLCLAVRGIGLGVFLAALLGIAQIFAFFDLRGGSAIDRAMTCAALGMPFWTTINVISRAAKVNQVVILGGGFAGVSTAEHLEKQFRDDPSVSFTLISETNSWLFTPMLVEVATSGLEPTHISTPLRTSLKRTRVLRNRVTSIDLERRQVHLNDEIPQTGVQYDHLVLALGSVSNRPASSAIAENALEFKTLGDAMRIRNHVIDLFERADSETDAGHRRAMLTFVIAGGGFRTGVLAGRFVRDWTFIYLRLPGIDSDATKCELVSQTWLVT
jgi:hypothetical protein